MDLGTLFLELLFMLLVAGATAAASSLIMLLMFKASRTLVQTDVWWAMYFSWLFWILAITVVEIAALTDPVVRNLSGFWPQVVFTLSYIIAFKAIFEFTQKSVSDEIASEAKEKKKIEKDRQQRKLLRLLQQRQGNKK